MNAKLTIGALTAGLLLAGGGIAAADPSTSPAPSPSGSVTVTLSAEQVAWLCTDRLPKTAQRTTKLIDRINGGADVKGSTAWLKARADKEKAAGHTTTAQLLTERADRRADSLDKLNKVKSMVADFQSKYCGGAK